MAIAVRQSAQFYAGASTSTIPLAYASNVLAGSLLFAAIIHPSPSDPDAATVADSLSQSWTRIDVAWETTVNVHGAVYYFANSSAGTTPTVTATLPAGRSDRAMIIAEFTGCDTSASVIHKHAVTQTTTFTTGTDGQLGPSITPTTNNCMIVGVIGTQQASTLAAGTGYTQEQYQTNTSRILLEDKIQSSAAAIQPTFTCGSALHGFLFSVALLPATTTTKVPWQPVARPSAVRASRW